jgi:hypothetical protein
MTRLATLRNRREKLISANEKYFYTQTSNIRIEKYYKVMLAIRKEINDIECVNVRPPNARIGLNAKDLRELTKPIAR